MAYEKTIPFRDRAYQHYQGEMVSLTRLLEKPSVKHGLTSVEEYEEYREPLSLDERKEVTVLLSWGGPSDGYKVYFDKDGEAAEGFYFFADWFEYEEFKLSNEELDRVLAIYF